MARTKLVSEIVWWCIISVVTAILLLHVESLTRDYPFRNIHALFVIISLLFLKHSFYFKYSFFSKVQWVKAILVFLCIPLLFKLIEFLNHFLTYTQNNTYDSFMKPASYEQMEKGFQMIYFEILLFGITSILITILFMGRLIVSLWRVRNGNRV